MTWAKAWPTTARISKPPAANGAPRRSGASASFPSSTSMTSSSTMAAPAVPAEAILWHGGEAEAAREAFRNAAKPERDALIAFLNSL